MRSLLRGKVSKLVRLRVISQQLGLAKAGSLEGSCLHETLGLGRDEPSFDHGHDSHRRRRDCVSYNRAADANAAAYWAAMATLVGAIEAIFFGANLVSIVLIRVAERLAGRPFLIRPSTGHRGRITPFSAPKQRGHDT